MSQSILVVAAHPDDEVLGMGGTIARHVQAGDQVHLLFLGDGVTSRQQADRGAIEARRSCAESAAALLGAEIAGFGTFPDNRFDTVALLELVQFVETVKKQVGPRIVYTHHLGDLNIDHRLTAQAVMTAFRPLPGETYSELYSFEVKSSTEWGAVFVPDTYIDISPYLQKLLSAYACYVDEVREDPHARSPEAVRIAAQGRGREVGLEAAEAFVSLKRILR